MTHLLLSVGVTSAFSVRPTSKMALSGLSAVPETVEVCGFKDCRRAGGGARLENLVKDVSLSCVHFTKNEAVDFLLKNKLSTTFF